MALKIKRMGHHAVLVDNVSSAVEFYTNNFGFEIGYEAEDWGIVRKGPDDLAFIKKGATEHPPHFGLRVESNQEVDNYYSELKDKVKILRTPKLHRDDSYSFYFSDPDRNVVEIIFDPNNP